MIMKDDNTRRYKVYAYAAEGVFITYERELIADINDDSIPPTELIYSGMSGHVYLLLYIYNIIVIYNINSIGE